METKIVDFLTAYEESYLDPKEYKINRINPFRTVGLTISQIANGIGAFKSEEFRLDSGRLPYDNVAMNKAIKSLLKHGIIEEVGSQRTLHCGSKAKMCYALTGFSSVVDSLERKFA